MNSSLGERQVFYLDCRQKKKHLKLHVYNLTADIFFNCTDFIQRCVQTLGVSLWRSVHECAYYRPIKGCVSCVLYTNYL
jgi:hypothetical protein